MRAIYSSSHCVCMNIPTSLPASHCISDPLCLPPPQDGMILIDDVPLPVLDASWWRRQAALVAQEPVLFACSVEENITYGCSAATTQEAVISAAQAFYHLPSLSHASHRPLSRLPPPCARSSPRHAPPTPTSSSRPSPMPTPPSSARGACRYPLLHSSPLLSPPLSPRSSPPRLLSSLLPSSLHACSCRAGRSSASPSRARCWSTRASCCSTRPRQRWMPSRSTSCR